MLTQAVGNAMGALPALVEAGVDGVFLDGVVDFDIGCRCATFFTFLPRSLRFSDRIPFYEVVSATSCVFVYKHRTVLDMLWKLTPLLETMVCSPKTPCNGNCHPTADINCTHANCTHTPQAPWQVNHALQTTGRNIWIRDAFCYRVPAHLVAGVPTKTCLESAIKTFNPQLMCDWVSRPTLASKFVQLYAAWFQRLKAVYVKP